MFSYHQLDRCDAHLLTKKFNKTHMLTKPVLEQKHNQVEVWKFIGCENIFFKRNYLIWKRTAQTNDTTSNPTKAIVISQNYYFQQLPCPKTASV